MTDKPKKTKRHIRLSLTQAKTGLEWATPSLALTGEDARRSTNFSYISLCSTNFLYLPLLRSVPDCQDNHAFATYPVEHDVRLSTDNQFANFRLCADASEIGMLCEIFDHSDDPCCQPGCGLRLVFRDVSPNFFQARQR